MKTCQRCGTILPWDPGPNTCVPCGRAMDAQFHNVDTQSMQRMSNKLQSAQMEQVRQAAAPGPVLSLSLREFLTRARTWSDEVLLATFSDGATFTLGELRKASRDDSLDKD